MYTNLIKTVIAGVAAASLLGGCASQANKDPLEGLNRGVYKFNDTVDKAAVRPIAGAYKAVVPSPLRSGVSNFFSNLGDVVTVANDLLQFKISQAMDDAGRVAINTTFGIGGVFDWASKDGIQKHNEDFGQTMGYWGWKDSAYLVLPFIGPSTVRDTGGLFVDSAFFDPIYYADPQPRNIMLVTKFIDRRSQYLPGSDLLDEAALDPYVFMRDAYMQRRSNMINGGNAPVDDNSKDGADADDASTDAAATQAPADKAATDTH